MRRNSLVSKSTSIAEESYDGYYHNDSETKTSYVSSKEHSLKRWHGVSNLNLKLSNRKKTDTPEEITTSHSEWDRYFLPRDERLCPICHPRETDGAGNYLSPTRTTFREALCTPPYHEHINCPLSHTPSPSQGMFKLPGASLRSPTSLFPLSGTPRSPPPPAQPFRFRWVPLPHDIPHDLPSPPEHVWDYPFIPARSRPMRHAEQRSDHLPPRSTFYSTYGFPMWHRDRQPNPFYRPVPPHQWGRYQDPIRKQEEGDRAFKEEQERLAKIEGKGGRQEGEWFVYEADHLDGPWEILEEFLLDCLDYFSIPIRRIAKALREGRWSLGLFLRR